MRLCDAAQSLDAVAYPLLLLLQYGVKFQLVHGRALYTMPWPLSASLLWPLHARAACVPLPVHGRAALTWWRLLMHICHLLSPMPYRYVGMTRPQDFLVVVEASPQMAVLQALAKMRHLETG